MNQTTKFTTSDSGLLQVPSSLILVVDDIPNNLKVVRRLLAKTNHQLTFASSGQQTLDRLQSVRPDLILLDLMMPEMDGLEVCQRVKQTPETADIPIIFLTASHELEHLMQAFKQGAVDYVAKPFRSAELLARINTHLRLMHLQKQRQQQIIQETIIRRVIEDIHSSLNLETILTHTVNDIQDFLNATRVIVCQQITATDCRIITTTHTAEPLPPCSLLLPIKQKQCRLSIDHLDVLSSEEQQWLNQCAIHTELRFPLCSGKVLWGVLIVQFAEPGVDETKSTHFLQPLMDQLAIAIRQSELYYELKNTHQELVQTVDQLEQANTELTKLANIDGLTQIANRRAFDARIEHEWMRLRREQQPLSLILIDIDHFKIYNDTYGHIKGDACLQTIAHTLDENIKRPADLVARYGGEEFVALLPNTNEEGAEQMAQKLQEAIAQLQLPHRAHLSNSHVTISLGIATTIPSTETSPETFICKADKALYQAKANGRNTYYLAK
jgi:diguanylate cyclase (GGDEF)-like protein